MSNIKEVCIVGGGTAGLISALILKTRFPKKNIKIIKSDKIGIIGVGEGSTEHFRNFMNYCNITPKEIIKECDATIKLGVMFEGWTKVPYFHNLEDRIHSIKFGQYLAGFGFLINSNINQIDATNQLYKTNEIKFSENTNESFSINQFHFNTFKLNNFLQKKCEERGITIINDEIKKIIIKNNNIYEVIGEKLKHKSDFFIDSTGFKRILISKLGAKWKSYNNYLKLNHAIAFQTEDTENYNIYTLSKAMKYGWMWRIPVYGRWGNGYIFDDTLINAEQAKKEVEKVLKKKITVAKDIKFEAGALDKVWIGNCIAVGLSANFVEPLEATSIGTSINQMFLLIHMLENYNQNAIDDYNKKINFIMENIRDFVFLHYMVERKDTKFWRKIKKIKPPKTLIEKLNKWSNRLPILDDFKETNYFLFFENNWTSVLWGLNLLNKDKIKKEYNSFGDDWKTHCIVKFQDYKKSFQNLKIAHKKFLDDFRKNT
jgi:flavin-dependent dehydrogenase